MRTSSAMLQQVVDQLPQAIGWKDKDAVFLGCNQAFAQAVGLTHPDEIVGKAAHEVQWQNHPSDFLYKHDRPLLEQQQAAYHQLEILPYTQPPVYLDVSHKALHDEHGTVTGVLAVIDETADHRQVEESLQLTQFAVDHAADAIWWVEVDSTIAYINDAGCRDLGYARDEILGRKVWDFNPDVLEATWADQWQMIKTLGSYTFETHNRHRDGTSYPVEVAINYIELNGKEYQCAFVRNIADRKQANFQLQESQQLLQLVMDNIPQLIFWKDRNSVYLGCNRNFSLAAGLDSPEHIIGKTDYSLPWTKGESDWFRACDRRVIESNTPELHIIETQQQAGGEQTWADTNKIPLHDAQGDVIGILGTYENITDRKRAEAALQLTQFAIDHASDAMWWVEPDGTICYVNDAACHQIGYRREEIVAKRIHDFAKGFTDEAWAHHWEEVKERGSFSFETHNQHRDGTLYPVEVTVNYVELNGKELNCSTVRNITDRKQAEAALQESEQQMREQANRERLLNRLLSRIRDSLDFDTILETTLQEVQNFTKADRCQFAWYDPNHEESYWEVVKETHYADLLNLVDRYPVSPTSPLLVQLLSQEVLRVEDAETLPESSLLRFVRRFNYRSMLAIPLRMQSGLLGTIFCCHSTEPHVWTDNEVELIQAVMGQLAIALTQAKLYTQSRTKAQELEQALHELQKTQTQMVQSEKMSSLGQLVAGVAHEINNPVNFIYGNLTHASSYTQDLLHLIELYQQHYPAPVPEIQAEADAIDLDFLLDDLPKLLSSMKVGADRIQKIVLSLRNFSRMDEADVKQVDIHEGIDSTLMILQSRLKGKAGQSGIAIVKKYGQLPPVECYPGQLNQVFMNLLVNAIDALEESGCDRSDRQPTIHIQTERSTDQTIVIKIADNGCGITQAQQQRLFDPFFTTKAVGKGTGLGLSISYQIVVEKHGGALTCFSAQGEGTEFCIEIPVQRL